MTRSEARSPLRPTRITAVILTLDEAEHLPACLESIAWADGILVVDSGSTDATATIARAHGAEVVEHAFENFSRQRQFGLERAAGEWVLFVDADERVPPALAAEIRATVSRPAEARSEPMSAYWIPRRNEFWGRVLRGGGWWPDHQLRLLRREDCRYDPSRTVHEVADVRGAVGWLEHPLTHLNYDSMREFRSKQRAYGRLEARRRIAAGMRPPRRHLLTAPLRELVRRLVTLKGYRDGLLGARLALEMAVTEWRIVTATRRAAALDRDSG